MLAGRSPGIGFPDKRAITSEITANCPFNVYLQDRAKQIHLPTLWPVTDNIKLLKFWPILQVKNGFLLLKFEFPNHQGDRYLSVWITIFMLAATIQDGPEDSCLLLLTPREAPSHPVPRLVCVINSKWYIPPRTQLQKAVALLLWVHFSLHFSPHPPSLSHHLALEKPASIMGAVIWGCLVARI